MASTPHNGTQGDRSALNGAAPKPSYRFAGDDLPAALEHLRHERRWVAWDYEWRNGRWTKPPRDPRTGGYASVANPATWGTFTEALAGTKRHGLAGVGLVPTDDGDIIGIDLDDCVNDAGSFTPFAAEIIGYGETYTETSPSGEGIRLFGLGKIERALKDDALGVEVYSTGRYLTVTGNQVDGTPSEIRLAPRTLDKLTAHCRRCPGGKTSQIQWQDARRGRRLLRQRQRRSAGPAQ